MEKKRSAPISRHEALRPLSREHHFGLQLCWKIRRGFQKNIPAQRVKTYCDWFYSRYLVPHFEIEEKFLFPILGADHEWITKAVADHRQIEGLINERDNVAVVLQTLEKTLDQHIRFEERVLFNEIQNVATADQLQLMKEVHQHELQEEKYDDEFWL